MPGGKGGNQAIASARDGVVTWLAGRTGDDEAGRIMTANLKAAGVDVSMLQAGAGEISGASVAIVKPFGDFGAIVVGNDRPVLRSGCGDDASGYRLSVVIPRRADIRSRGSDP